MAWFERDPRPIRQLRAALNMVALTWDMQDRMPISTPHQSAAAAQAAVREHVRAAVDVGHAAMAREVLTKARRRRLAGPQRPGMRWEDVIDAGMRELPA